MRRTRKVSNVYGKVHFKQKQRLTIVLLEIQSTKESSPVKAQKISLLIKKHANVPKANSPTVPPRNYNT